MGKGNAAVKQWLKNKERFADLFNGTMFQGKKIILPEELESIESEADILITDKGEQTREIQRYRDLVMRWKSGVHLVILGCENQAKIHYAMPVRNMLYDSLSYTEQVKLIGERSQNEPNKKMTEEEFLSKFCKDDKIYPVITLVLYYGQKKWDASINLYDMFPKEVLKNELEILKKYVPNYQINLVEANNIENLEVFQTDLQEIFGMLQYRNNKKDLVNYIRTKETYFRNVDEETYQVIREFLHSERILKKEISKGQGKGTINMCKALEDLYNDGIEQGEQKKLLDLIKKKLEKGKTVEMIAEELEETTNTIQKLMKELDKE